MATKQPRGNNGTLRRQFLDVGFVHLKAVIEPATIAGFVAQIQEELESTDGIEKERSVGRVFLHDKSTWPQGKARRVVECAPVGDGPHWEKLRSSPILKESLDAIVGPSCWELEMNVKPTASNETPIRHWYFPITFPELPVYPKKSSKRSHEDLEVKNIDLLPRPVCLRSWRDELNEDGPLLDEDKDAPSRWQPVSRRRFRGKGWHIDSGPGFRNDDIRTSQGHPFQCVVMLLLLSDSESGGGGTCVLPYSHKLVHNKLIEQKTGMSHHELNSWCVSEMRRMTDRGELLLVSSGLSTKFSLGHVPQVIGVAGDVILLHPLLIHSGTTNLRTSMRLMGNGMVRMKKEVYETRGGMFFMPLTSQ
jgi:hypothetical protein